MTKYRVIIRCLALSVSDFAFIHTYIHFVVNLGFLLILHPWNPGASFEYTRNWETTYKMRSGIENTHITTEKFLVLPRFLMLFCNLECTYADESFNQYSFLWLIYLASVSMSSELVTRGLWECFSFNLTWYLHFPVWGLVWCSGKRYG